MEWFWSHYESHFQEEFFLRGGINPFTREGVIAVESRHLAEVAGRLAAEEAYRRRQHALILQLSESLETGRKIIEMLKLCKNSRGTLGYATRLTDFERTMQEQAEGLAQLVGASEGRNRQEAVETTRRMAVFG